MIRYIALLCWIACATPAPEEATTEDNRAPDILLITLDTTRADRIGAYGDPLARTPSLDALAKQSILFREAYTTVHSLCRPTHRL